MTTMQLDSAICGLAIGAGFALVENVFYLRPRERFFSGPLPFLRGCLYAIEALEEVDPRKSRVVEMRYFGGREFK